MQMLAAEIVTPLSVKQDRRIAGLTPVSWPHGRAAAPYLSQSTVETFFGGALRFKNAAADGRWHSDGTSHCK